MAGRRVGGDHQIASQPNPLEVRLDWREKPHTTWHLDEVYLKIDGRLSLALFLMPQVSLAVDDHISQAIEYTNLAIDDGKHGRADGLAMHAEAALTHAEASEKVKAAPHTADAIKNLKEAIDESKQGHVDVATTH